VSLKSEDAQKEDRSTKKSREAEAAAERDKNSEG
jgi:hypothetical protein